MRTVCATGAMLRIHLHVTEICQCKIDKSERAEPYTSVLEDLMQKAVVCPLSLLLRLCESLNTMRMPWRYPEQHCDRTEEG